MFRLLTFPIRLISEIITLPFKIKLFKVKTLTGLLALVGLAMVVTKAYDKFIEVGGSYLKSETPVE